MHLSNPDTCTVSTNEWNTINAVLEFCVENPGRLPPSPTGKTTIDFLQHIQRGNAPGKILVADVSGRLGKKAPYFELGNQPFDIVPWAHYCSSGLHIIVQRGRAGCLRRIETLASESVGYGMVDLDSTRPDGEFLPDYDKKWPQRQAAILQERRTAMLWCYEHGYTTAITPHGFRIYLRPSRLLLMKQAERELEPFIKHVFHDFPWHAAALKLCTCSWSRLNGERISPILLWRPETMVPVPEHLPRILYDKRDHRIGVVIGGAVTTWKKFQGKERRKALQENPQPQHPAPMFGHGVPLLGDKCGRIPMTSAEKREACSKALGMRMRYLAWGELDLEIHSHADHVWQAGDLFVLGVSEAVGLVPDEIADIFNRYPPEQPDTVPTMWGKLNVPCHKIYCGNALPIRSRHGVKQHYAEFARSIYVFPFHGFSLRQTMSVAWRYFELLTTSHNSNPDALELVLEREANGDGFRGKCRTLLDVEKDMADGLASLLKDTAALLGGDEALYRWLDRDCLRLCRKFWDQPWQNSCEVSQPELEKVLIAVRDICAGDTTRVFTTAEVAEKAEIQAKPLPEQWIAKTRQIRQQQGKTPQKTSNSPEKRQRIAAHHKTQVALQLLGCHIVTDGLKNPNRPGCNAKRQAPPSILNPAWKPSTSPPTSPAKSLCPSNSLACPPQCFRSADLVEGLETTLPALAVSQLTNAAWGISVDVVCDRLSSDESRWKLIIYRLKKAADSRYKDSLPPMLQAVRECLGQEGHVYHPLEEVEALLLALTDNDKEQAATLLAEIIASALVIDVSFMVQGSGRWVAWRRFLEGEAALALSVVRHAKGGGKAEILFGEPGTGKTESLSSRIFHTIQTGQSVNVGSAQNNSARSLEDRVLKKHGINQPVLTVHKSFQVPVDAERFKQRPSQASSLFADEFGQLDAYTAGAMSSRWRQHHDITLSVGPDQLLPVGPGCVGENLIECLRQRPLPGWKLTELTHNHRAASSPGIVSFFRGIRAGQIAGCGPALSLIAIPDKFITHEVFLSHAVKVAMIHRGNLRDESEPVTCFVPLDELGAVQGAEHYRQALNRQTGFNIGEYVIIREQDDSLSTKRFVRGAAARVIGIDRDGRVRVEELSPKSGCRPEVASFPSSHLRLAFCRTVHGAQGFEVDFGIVALVPSRITDRRWLYTAVSRCRRQCVILYRKNGQRDDLAECIAKNPARRTLFSHLFNQYADQALAS